VKVENGEREGQGEGNVEDEGEEELKKRKSGLGELDKEDNVVSKKKPGT